LTAAQMTSLQQTAMLGGAANARVASYVLLASDAGNSVTMSNAGATTITVNSALFAEGDIVTIINLGAGACTITAGTATVTTSGSLVLAQNQGGVLRFTSASAAIFFQFATPASGDIEGVTAGTGLSGGGTSGTVTVSIDTAVTADLTTAQTLTNKTLTSPVLTTPTISTIDAKGDLLAGTGDNTIARLAVGANNLVLTADSAEATGLKWAAPDPLTTKGDLFTFSTTEARLGVGANDTVLTADSTAATGLKWAAASSGGMTLLSTTTLSGASTTVSSISQSYTDLKIVIKNAVQAAASTVFMRINGTNAPNYNYGWFQTANGTFTQNSNEGYYQIDNITAAVTGNTDNRRVGASIDIPQYTNTTNQFIFWSSIGGAPASTYQTYVTGGAQFVGSNVTSITIGSTSSTFSSGTMYIYGVK